MAKINFSIKICNLCLSHQSKIVITNFHIKEQYLKLTHYAIYHR